LDNIKECKDAVNGRNVQEIKDRQHTCDPFKQITGARILVLNGYCNSAKQPINQEEVYSTEAKDFEKTTPGL